MTKSLRGAMLLATLSGVIPLVLSATSASAGLFDFGRRCHHCQRPATTCHCTSHQPVTETQMVPQQTTVMRNQVVTQFRQEAYTQAIPVTTYRDVTVDEGGYQMVYVPKPVTKKVAQTTYQQQTAYRTVPYQVTQQVPHVITQMVPQQIVRQQPISFTTAQTGPIIPAAPTYSQVAVGCAPIVPTCGPCGTVAYAPAAVAPVISQPIISSPTIATPIAPNPVTMLPPTTTSASTSAISPDVDSSVGPVPDPKFLDSPGAVKESWTTVGSRRGNRNVVDSSQTASSTNNKIRFKPAGTLYRSWESQSRIAAGDGPVRK